MKRRPILSTGISSEPISPLISSLPYPQALYYACNESMTDGDEPKWYIRKVVNVNVLVSGYAAETGDARSILVVILGFQ
jgi:hypothetical protein